MQTVILTLTVLPLKILCISSLYSNDIYKQAAMPVICSNPSLMGTSHRTRHEGNLSDLSCQYNTFYPANSCLSSFFPVFPEIGSICIL